MAARAMEDENLEVVMEAGSDTESELLERFQDSDDDMQILMEDEDFDFSDSESDIDMDDDEYDRVEVLGEAEEPIREDPATGKTEGNLPKQGGDSVWVKTSRHNPLALQFSGPSGIQFDLPADAPPVAFYKLMITDDLIKMMTEETNRYAAQCIAAKPTKGKGSSKKSIFKQWKAVSEQEMQIFLAILIHMGIPFEDVWAQGSVLITNHTKNAMEQERFSSILAFFHLNDNNLFQPKGVLGRDPLHKVRPLYDHLNEKFSSLYLPGESICIKETHCLCKKIQRARFGSWKNKIPKKLGVKLRILRDCQSGFALKVQAVPRKCDGGSSASAPAEEYLQLLEPLLGSGHTLYMEKDSCSPALAQALVSKNTAFVGSLDVKVAGLPEEFIAEEVARDQMGWRSCKEMLVIKGLDDKATVLLTTKHEPQMVRTRVRRKEVLMPSAVADYLANIACAGMHERMLDYLPAERDSLKWWKKVVIYLLTMTTVQAHVLYNKHQEAHGRPTMKLCGFAERVIAGLAGLRVDPPEQPSPADRLTGHFIVHIPGEGGESMEKPCKVCYETLAKSGASKEELERKTPMTPYHCRECRVPLCIDPCHQKYHTQEDYTV